MPKPQLHRRLPGPFVGEVLEAFNAHRMSETQACTLLGIKRARLYRLRRDWLRGGKQLLATPARVARTWPPEVEAWLHGECQYLRDHAGPFRGRFNFAVLAEAAEQHFLGRSTARRYAAGRSGTGTIRGHGRKSGRPICGWVLVRPPSPRLSPRSGGGYHGEPSWHGRGD